MTHCAEYCDGQAEDPKTMEVGLRPIRRSQSDQGIPGVQPFRAAVAVVRRFLCVSSHLGLRSDECRSGTDRKSNATVRLSDGARTIRAELHRLLDCPAPPQCPERHRYRAAKPVPYPRDARFSIVSAPTPWPPPHEGLSDQTSLPPGEFEELEAWIAAHP